MVRLFIYNREAHDKPDPEKSILQNQFMVMIKRLWFGITWPSCILTLIFGTWMLILHKSIPTWLIIKISFVIGLLIYHFSIHHIYKQQNAQKFKYTSQQLRIWNEVATLFLFVIVFLVVLKESLSFFWIISGPALLFGVILVSIKIFKFYKKT
jgi:Predicted membrane protein